MTYCTHTPPDDMSTTLSPIPHTHQTKAKPKALHAFNSVVFVLALLATFSLVTTEVVQAMWLLLELACHYNYTHERRVPMSESIHQRALACFDILVVLAGHRGYQAKIINKNKMTKKDMQEMLSAIIDPLLRGRTDEELTELEMTARSGGEVLIMPLDEICRLVHMWTQALRGEEVDQDQLDKFGQDYEPGSLEWQSETSRVQLWESGDAEVNGNSDEERDVKLGIDPRTKPERVEAWSKTRMDETMSETMATYCPGYAAVSTRSTLRRKARTEKVAGRCRGFILFTTNEPMERIEEPTITTTENETGAMCVYGVEKASNEDLGLPTQEQCSGEATDWSQDEDGEVWDMIPTRVEQHEQDTTDEREATGWAAKENEVEWSMENTQAKRVVEWLQDNHLALIESTSVSESQYLEGAPNAGPDHDTLAARSGRTGMDPPVDIDDLFGTSASWAAGRGAVTQHHYGALHARATLLKRGLDGLDEEADEYSSTMAEVLGGENMFERPRLRITQRRIGNELRLACSERPAKRRRLGAALTLEEAEAQYERVPPLARHSTSRVPADLATSIDAIGRLQSQSPSRGNTTVDIDQHDLGEPEMPPTPLKHRRHGSSEDLWNAYTIDVLSQPERQVGPDTTGRLEPTTLSLPSVDPRHEFRHQGGVVHGVGQSCNEYSLVGLLFPVQHSVHISTNNPTTPTASTNPVHYELYPGLLNPTQRPTDETGNTNGQAGPPSHFLVDTLLAMDPRRGSGLTLHSSDGLVMPATPLKHNRGADENDPWGAPYVTHFDMTNQAETPGDAAIAMDTPRTTSTGERTPSWVSISGLQDMQTPAAPRLAQGRFDSYTWAIAHTSGQQSPAELTPRNAIEQTQEVGAPESTTEVHLVERGSSTLPYHDVRTPETALMHVGYENRNERARGQSTMQPLRIVTRKPVPRDPCAANHAAEEASTTTLANETSEICIVETSSGWIDGKVGHELGGVRTEGVLGYTTRKTKRPLRVLRVVNGSPSLTSSSSSSSTSLPRTPRTEESGYSMSKATLAYCDEMTTYWEQSVRQKWQDGVAQWNEDDMLPEPSAKLGGGVVRRMMAALGWPSD
ncbi:hypothetical protein RhiJN_13366 [Ceratobasidium sp. AG-Ba]|nr:hypothetical protein RhiJN_13366 [Ceratobasidium sp. AG-Ba]